MGLVVHERVGFEGRRISPFSWRLRYALAHKGLEVEFLPTRFADVDRIRALSGQHFVPILVDDGHVVHDTWSIATYLEERFPERKSLFGGPMGRGLARWTNLWSIATLAPAMRRLISADFIWCIDTVDRAYFRSSREAQFGCTLEEHCADRPRWLTELATATAPLEATFGEQPYLCGDGPGYADYLVFSIFQWARIGSPHEVLMPGSGLFDWRARMVGLYGGLGDMFPSYPAERVGGDGR